MKHSPTPPSPDLSNRNIDGVLERKEAGKVLNRQELQELAAAAQQMDRQIEKGEVVNKRVLERRAQIQKLLQSTSSPEIDNQLDTAEARLGEGDLHYAKFYAEEAEKLLNTARSAGSLVNFSRARQRIEAILAKTTDQALIDDALDTAEDRLRTRDLHYAKFYVKIAEAILAKIGPTVEVGKARQRIEAILAKTTDQALIDDALDTAEDRLRTGNFNAVTIHIKTAKRLLAEARKAGASVDYEAADKRIEGILATIPDQVTS